MNKRQLTVIGIVLFAAVVLFTVMSFRQEAQTNKPQDEKATIVRKGQVTAEEWEYTKELKKFYGNGDGQKITELPGKGDIGITFGPGSVAHSTNEPVITASQFLGKLSCQADAVLVGTVKSKESHLSADETFVYTAYDFEVKRIIKDNSKFPVGINNTITVTRPGGLINIDGRKIQFNDGSYEPLKLNKEYLLFLKFIPEANGYKASSSDGDFALENNTFRSISNSGVVKQLREGTDSERLLNMVQNSVSSNCNQYLSVGKGNE